MPGTKQHTAEATLEPAPPGLPQLFSVFFRVGLLTFGGGYAMLPVLRYELTSKRGWIPEDAFRDMVSSATALPGPIAVNTSFLFGRHIRGALGTAVALLGVILPSFMVMLLIATFLIRYFMHPLVTSFFTGAAAAVTAQIAYAGILYGKRLFTTLWKIGLAVVIFGLLVYFSLHPLLAIALSLVLGLPLARLEAQRKAQRARQRSAEVTKAREEVQE